MNLRILLLAISTLLIVGCTGNTNLGSSGPEKTCAETGDCQLGAVMLKDQFERSNVLVNTTAGADELNFWWRKIINDQGRVVAGTAGNNVDVRIFSSPDLGPGSDDGSALYFFGRQGASVHSLYLVSQTFDLRQATRVDIQFRYLPIDLEDSEYLRLEVCRATRDECGVGDDISVSGLNSDHWEVLFEADNSIGEGLNGKNHTAEDWQFARVQLDINSKDLRAFTFRFHVKMNDGFVGNVVANGMDDGAGLDQVNAYAFRKIGEPQPVDDDDDDDDDDGSDLVNPFDLEPIFDPDDPRLFQ
ncbi:MAG: hypothetical protein AAF202_07190 [Pseudomonadota bacterium]